MYRWPYDTTAPQQWYYPDYYQPQYWTWQTWYSVCPKCGWQVASTDRFCPHCGTQLWVESDEDKIVRLEKKVEELLEEVRRLSEKAKKERATT